MNIMIIAKSLSGGGAERVATNLATSLSKTDNVILVVFNAHNNTYGSTVETIDLKMPEDKGTFRIFWHLNARNKIKKLKKQYNITHAISFMAEPDLANVTSRGTEKVIISVRNKHSSSSPTRLHFLKNKWVFNKADALVALSKMVKQDLITEFGVLEEKITPIYNPCYIDTIQKKSEEDVFSATEKQFFQANKGRIVITAGRLNPQKGQWHLIRAFKKVLETVPDAKLVILGQGEEEAYLLNLIRDLEISDSVYLYGYKSNPYPYLSCADLFAFPSVFEGLGNILIECMACQLPIVSADCPYGPKELLAPNENTDSCVNGVDHARYGILVPPMDSVKYSAAEPLQYSEACMADAIIEMLINQELREDYKYRIAGRGKDFSPDEITHQWIKVLEHLD